jgi:hypothetical protein
MGCFSLNGYPTPCIHDYQEIYEALDHRVCFKECKQLLGLGKDQSNDFNAQVFSTTASFLRYNLMNFLNEKESATIAYARRLWDFFRGLFSVAISKIFDLFKIEEQCSPYIDAFSQALSASTPFQGCET